MRLVTVAGAPSSGKTSVILRAAEGLTAAGITLGVIKFDCLSIEDESRYRQAGIPVKIGLAGSLCPDHFSITNIEACLQWGRRCGFDILISESAGQRYCRSTALPARGSCSSSVIWSPQKKSIPWNRRN